MPIVDHEVLRTFVYDMYIAAGGVEEDARIVSDHVVDSNLAGHDSHGVINAPNYARGMQGGPAAAKLEIVRETPASAVINANGALGMVAARKAMDMAIEKAQANTLGAVGLLIRRNPLVMFMCVELMLNAVNITFVALGAELNDVTGQVAVFFVLVVAAVEVVVGLALVVALNRRRPDATADDISLLRG